MKTTKLEKLRACNDAVAWVKSQNSPEEAWQNCERGDWMLWIAKKLDVDDRKLTLAKAACVKQVKHLLTNQRSKDALERCFDYEEGKITREELNVLDNASFAVDAVYSAAASAVYSAAYAAYTDAVDAVRKESLKRSADICREILTEDVLEKY